MTFSLADAGATLVLRLRAEPPRCLAGPQTVWGRGLVEMADMACMMVDMVVEGKEDLMVVVEEDMVVVVVERPMRLATPCLFR